MAQWNPVIELFYNDLWNDHTSDVYVRDQITITHGATDVYSSAQPSSCRLTFDDRDAQFHPRNANSLLFGLIGHYTPIRVTVNGQVRFAGEVASWIPRQVIGGDAWTQIVAYGISHRLGQGSTEPLSAMRDYMQREATDVVAYWPMEDGNLARSGKGQGTSNLVGIKFFGVFPNLFDVGGPLTKLGAAALLAPWLLNGLSNPECGGLVTMTSTPGGTGWNIELIFNGTGTANGILMLILAEGNGAGADGAEKIEWQFVLTTDGVTNQTNLGIDDGTVQGYLIDGIEVPASILTDGQAHLLRIGVRQVSTNQLNIRAWVDGVEYQDFTFSSEPVILDGLAAVGVLRNGEVTIGHLNVGLSALVDQEWTNHLSVAFGSRGLIATHQMQRVAAQYDGLNLVFVGGADKSINVGPRYTEPMLTVLREAAATDGGLLYDNIAIVGMTYRAGSSLYNQQSSLTLNWEVGQIALPLEPNIDDTDIRNRIVINRRDGQQVVVRDDTSISKIGLISVDHTISLPGDNQFLDYQARWRLHLGTDDLIRFARVTIDLDAVEVF